MRWDIGIDRFSLVNIGVRLVDYFLIMDLCDDKLKLIHLSVFVRRFEVELFVEVVKMLVNMMGEECLLWECLKDLSQGCLRTSRMEYRDAGWGSSM